MRFGHFFYPMKFDDSRDGQEIQACLDEAQLVEELGMDAIWFAEHRSEERRVGKECRSRLSAYR